ncbi:hypothetical protein SAY87_002269 [Trapa incisa]|uniref:P-type ATPase A domain-containing protein n=1 Tax=Trapa incisa TaxID=236973 RepID=A0AAN7JWP3_9MYRT|nr:hypothetical protein SAY87_002269 [Trapa incisa]
MTAPQKTLQEFAWATRWDDMANFLRENLSLCCCSAALFVVDAACPHLIPKPAVKTVQNSLILIAFPIVSASLDALTVTTAGKVNIHVLMALAAFASAFMGNPLEGGLLLVMFNMALLADEYFTSRSMIDVRELKENYPAFALLLDVDDNALPNFVDLAYRSVPVHYVGVDSYLLVGVGDAGNHEYCKVLQGRATVTIEHLNREVKPLETKIGDRIPGGARNLDGRIVVKATKTWKESTLSRIVQLTEEAQLNKPKLQRWLDEFGDRYSMVVVVISIAVAVVEPLLFKWPFINTSANAVGIKDAYCGLKPEDKLNQVKNISRDTG